MTALVVQSAIFAIALVAVAVHFSLRHARAEELWAKERQLLLTRIQHPERVATGFGPSKPVPVPRRDQVERVGRVAPPNSHRPEQ